MEKLIFLAVGKILVLLVVFFFLNFNSKSIEKMDFSSIWQDLGFAFACLFLLNSFCESLRNFTDRIFR